MIIPGDRHDFSDDIGLFNLGKIKNKAVCIYHYNIDLMKYFIQEIYIDSPSIARGL